MDDLDALFIDQQQPVAQPMPAGLHQRIDEMQRNGCCDKIAFGSNGSIVYVSDDNTLGVSLLRFKESEGRWKQQDYKPSLLQEHALKVFRGKPVSHISWNPHASDLVIADVYGRLIISAPFVNDNKLITQKVYDHHGIENEANRLVGLHWLHPTPPKKSGAENKSEKIPYFPAATKQSNRWVFGHPEPLSVLGPVNPWGKSGFIAVTVLGKIQLHYSTPDMNWWHDEHEFFKPEEPASQLTHAAFCASKENEVVIAGVEASKNVRLASIRVNWTQAPGQQREHPQLKIDNLICFKLYGPALEMQMPLSTVFGGGNLSFVRLLYDRTAGEGEDVLPTLLAGYHVQSNAVSDFGVSDQGMSTTIIQYSLRASTPEVAAAFLNLSIKRNMKQPLKPQVTVAQLEDRRLGGIVLDVHEQTFGKYLALTYSDGKIEFRDRELNILPLDSSPDKVSSLPQIGFSFDSEEPCLYNVFSAHACVRATVAKNEQPRISAIRVSAHLMMDAADAAFSDKASAAFILEHIGKGANGDFVDVMVAMRAFLDQLSAEQVTAWKTSFLRSFAYAMQVPARMHAETSEFILFNQNFQKFLAVQEALGHGTSDASLAGEFSQRTPSSHLAWILQNLRQIMTATLWLSRRPSRPGQPAEMTQPQPQGIVTLGHYGAWVGTLAEWAVTHILATNRALNYPKALGDLAFPHTQIMSHVSIPAQLAAAMLMLPVARNCFRVCIQGMRYLSQTVQNTPAHELPEHYRSIEKTMKDRVVLFSEFQKFIESIDKICGDTFSRQGDSAEVQNQRSTVRRLTETEVLIRAQCDASFAAVMCSLFTRGAWNLRESCDEAQLAFADYSSLDPLPADDGSRLKMAADVIWDGSRKVELGRRRVLRPGEDDIPAATKNGDSNGHGDGDANGDTMDLSMDADEGGKLSRKWMVGGNEIPALRVCTRCANVMEDQPPNRTRQGDLFARLMRQCYCGGHWVELD